MTPTISQLLSARPKAVEAIENDYNASLSLTDEENACRLIRSYCIRYSLGRPWLDSIETLLDLIEAKCVAEAPLSDAEIEGMKWGRDGRAVRTYTSCFKALNENEAIDAAEYHNDNIDRCHREIRRLRKGADHA